MKLVYTKLAHEKIMQWVHMSKFEVSGLGMVEIIEGIPTVTDVFLVKQKNHAVETEMDGGAIAELLYETREHRGELRVWWHSHVMMQCEWSPTDMTQMRALGKQGWHYHTVFNQKGEHKTAFTCPTGIEWLNPIHFYDEIKTEFENTVDPVLVKFCKDEYAAKVEEPKKTVVEYDGSWRVNEKKHAWLGPRETTNGESGSKSGPHTIEQQLSFETEKFDLRVEVMDMMDRHWSNKDINRAYSQPLARYGMSVKDIRKDWNNQAKGWSHVATVD